MKLAVIGDPVAHSRSPALHERFLREAAIEGSYAAIRVPAGETAAALGRMRAEGFTGCNVTSPLKEEAFACCEELFPEAERAEAVNTIYFGKRIIGTNTDGVGAVTALRAPVATPLEKGSVAVLGTGPTARAALAQLGAEGIRATLWGRDAQKVAALRARYGAAAWNEGEAEVALSTLPPGAVLPEDVAAWLQRVPIVMDANYGERSTLGTQLGRSVIDGAAMLEAQAKAAFVFWQERIAAK